MQDLKTVLILFNIPPQTEIAKELQSSLSNDDSIELVYMDDFKEAINYIRSCESAIFAFFVQNREEFVHSMTVLKSSHEKAKNGFFRPICISDIKNKKVESLLDKYNCVDVLPTDVKPKTFRTKVDLWKRALLNHLQQTRLKEEKLELSQREQERSVPTSEPEHKFSGDEFAASEEDFEQEISDIIAKEVDIDEGQTKKAKNFEEEMDMAFDSALDELEEELYIIGDDGPLFDKLDEEFSEENKKVVIEVDGKRDEELADYLIESKHVQNVNLDAGELSVILYDMEKKDAGEIPCKFESFFEDEVVLESPSEFEFKQGDVVEIAVKFIYDRCRVELMLDGVVSHFEVTESHGNIITINMQEFEHEKLEHFMTLFQQRQQSILDFLELARGY
jgi:hypothetical protein